MRKGRLCPGLSSNLLSTGRSAIVDSSRMLLRIPPVLRTIHRMNLGALLLPSGDLHTHCGLRGAEVGRSLWGNCRAVSSASQPFTQSLPISVRLLCGSGSKPASTIKHLRPLLPEHTGQDHAKRGLLFAFFWVVPGLRTLPKSAARTKDGSCHSCLEISSQRD